MVTGLTFFENSVFTLTAVPYLLPKYKTLKIFRADSSDSIPMLYYNNDNLTTLDVLVRHGQSTTLFFNYDHWPNTPSSDIPNVILLGDSKSTVADKIIQLTENPTYSKKMSMECVKESSLYSFPHPQKAITYQLIIEKRFVDNFISGDKPHHEKTLR